eukprot:CAMPEP_0185286224 /NCGR_PEP_ID=MMETSP1363-20130426/2142_1 /TAXON_ID=38817 /ORGANISM="Gephyrocapsa oceanica, Strain RCC1303" /LENGTH=641 /DNA_ID=CAMNT_0027882023 /DNA_START=25 /DNA_END=1947 /DNA_ORIENTATION=+
MPEAAHLAPVDIVLLVLYFVAVALVGLWTYAKGKRSTNTDATAEFFLAGRSMGWLPIGLSLFVSNIGSEHLVGLAGTAATSGLAVGLYEWSAGIHLLVLGWLFAPIYLRAQLATLPEYLERRFSRRLRSLFSCVTLFIYVFTKLSVSVFSGATVLQSVFGWPRLPAAAGLVLLTAVYTALGGLAAVIVTDMAQSAVLLVGALCMTVVGLERVGGYEALRTSPPANMTSQQWEGYFHMYRPPSDEDLPTLGLLLGQSVGGLWYWCLDQSIVQRVLSARSIGHARGATLLAALLKVAPVFLMVLPGVVARSLFSDELAAAGTNEALPILMKGLLPPGLLGLMLAATVAACMSSLDSVFTAAASLFCLDLYRAHLHPSAGEAELVQVGRAFCVLLAAVTLAWLPVITLLSDQVFIYIQSVSMYLAPPIVTVYFGGVLWRRATAEAATATFCLGYALGVGRLVGEIICKLSPPRPASLPALLFLSNYLYAGFVIFLLCVATLVLASLASPCPPPSQLDGLTAACSGKCLPRVATPRLKDLTTTRAPELPLPAAPPNDEGCVGSAARPAAPAAPEGMQMDDDDIRLGTTRSRAGGWRGGGACWACCYTARAAYSRLDSWVGEHSHAVGAALSAGIVAMYCVLIGVW